MYIHIHIHAYIFLYIYTYNREWIVQKMQEHYQALPPYLKTSQYTAMCDAAHAAHRNAPRILLWSQEHMHTSIERAMEWETPTQTLVVLLPLFLCLSQPLCSHTLTLQHTHTRTHKQPLCRHTHTHILTHAHTHTQT